ncbi:prepilin-type N-terminal cleavage/methylation domain-containing protein [Salinibacterium sp. SWN1162]|uniref:prepilin-type N-terminal cleavage/methylation domain-containing protein n=1 Tax=Salinibacterium sp. SWN1162 TaxID=2792053 RepID=UPI0018CF82EF|nr:prepilin-type N-terminal cleavage/methylation domain-containing protein [Salinibacterium sp. SWN1162]MBH0008441.1 prepilin-type N-terminal cleavage/methylation domain-containing protein [Salinibacterium sp. SWN1162]
MNIIRTALLARVRRIRNDDSGVTLAELIVTIALLTMMLAMVMTIFISFTRSFTSDRSASTNTSSATVAMNELTRVIRSGTQLKTPSGTLSPVFSEATAEKVALTAYLDTQAASPRPVKVMFEITADRTLVEKRWEATGESNGVFTFKTGTPSSERTIVRQIAGNGTPVFSYLKSVNVATAGAPTETLWTESDPFSKIIAVTVSMTVQTDPSGEAATATLLNTVGIPNLDVPRIGFTP